MGGSAEVELAAAAIADVHVELGRRKIGVAEHLLDAAEICAAFQEMRRKRVPEQVGMDPVRLEPGLLGEPAQDEEDARPSEPAALRVQEELRPVAAVEVRTPAREIAANGVSCRPAERHDSFLRPL